MNREAQLALALRDCLKSIERLLIAMDAANAAPFVPGQALAMSPKPTSGTSEQQEREAFEAWFFASKYAQVSPPTKQNEQATWDGWQARAALAAKVPAGWHLSGYLYDFNDDSGVAIPDWFTSRADEANRQGHFNVRECYTRATPAPAPEAEPCIYPACQTNGCRQACEAPAQAQQSASKPPVQGSGQ